MSRWDLITADMRSEYGIDVSTRTSLRAVPWRTLKLLIVGLVSADTRLGRMLAERNESSRPRGYRPGRR